MTRYPKIAFPLILFFLTAISCEAQKITTFQKSFGGSQDDWGSTIIQLKDKGYMIAGLTKSYGSGGWDILVIRTDSLGKEIWGKTYGGSSDEGTLVYYINGVDMIQSPDSNFVLCCNTESYGKGGRDLYLIKININGTVFWDHTYGGSSDDYGVSVINDPNGGFLITGEYGNSTKGVGSVWLVKTDSGGGFVWSNIYGNSSYEQAGWRIKPSTAYGGSYLISGFGYSSANAYDGMLMRVDKTGKLIWNKIYGADNYDAGGDLVELPDRSICVPGYYYSTANSSAYGDLCKFDSTGKMLWAKRYFPQGETRTIFYDKVTHNLNILAGGIISGSGHLYLLRTDTAGNPRLIKAYGPTVSGQGYTYGAGESLVPIENGGMLMIGATNVFGSGGYDIYLLKMDSTGNPNSCYVTKPTLSPTNINFGDHTWAFSTSSLTPFVSSGVTVKTVTVSDSLVCAPFISDFNWQNPCANQNVQFQDSSYYKPTSWKWNFGDGSSVVKTQNPSHTYSKAGTYTVKLVSSNGSVTDSITKTISILLSPTHLKTTIDSFCVGDSINLKAFGTKSKTFSWIAPPVATLSDSTDSTIWVYPYETTLFKVNVTNSYGCTDQDTFKVVLDTSSKCGKPASISGVINNYAAVLFDYDSCYSSLVVDTASFFKVGSTALLIQMKGATIDTSNSSSFGTIKSIGNAGSYEYVTIDSVGGSKVYLRNKLLKSYDVKGLVQLVTVPQYTNVIISNPGLTGQPWNGTKGGVLVFEATGNIYMAPGSIIDMSYKGFRGGVFPQGFPTNFSGFGACHSSNYFYNFSESFYFGPKGEGISVFNSAYYTGRGANSNGGGGGNNEFSGGGGGGNFGFGGIGGKEWGNCSSPSSNGGVGGLNLVSYLKQNRIYLGGGGGLGSYASWYNFKQTNGGGIVLIKAHDLVSNRNVISSNGMTPQYNPNDNGANGGSAGGSILLNINNYPVNLQLQMNGGNGEYVNASPCMGPGGGGGGGCLLLGSSSVPKNLSWSASPGLAGLDIKTSASCYNTSYGADSGTSGGVVTNITIPQNTSSFTRPYAKIKTKSQTICYGDSVKLTAFVGGIKSFSWSPSSTVRIPASANTFAFPTTTTTYKLSVVTNSGCALVLDSVKIIVLPAKPVTPVITNSTVTDNADVQLSISMSSLTNVASVTTYVSVDGGSYTKVATSVPANTITVKNSSLSATKHHYTYVVIATDSCGNNSDSSVKHSPVLLQGTAGNLRNTLTWKNYIGYTVDSIVLQRQIKGSSTWLTIARPKTTTTSYIDSSYMKCGVSLSYRIITYGGSQVSLSDTITLMPYDIIPPTLVDIISASVTSGTNIALFFKKVSKTSTRKYLLYVKKDHSAFVLLDSVLSKNITGNAYTYNYKINTLTDTFSFEIFALDSCGNTSKTTEMHRSIQLNGKSLEDSSSLSWSNYLGFPVKNYIVQTWSKASGWTDYKTLPSTDSVFTELEHCNVTLNFRIKAEETGYIDTIAYSDSVQIQPFDTVPPAEVVIASASVADNSHITLTFNKVPDADAIGYVIYRSKDHGAFTDIDTIKRPSSPQIFFTDNVGNTTTDTFSYKVYAFDSCGNTSKLSKTHRDMRLVTSVKGCEKSIYLSWSAYLGWSSVKKYEIYRSVNGGSPGLLTTVSGTFTTYNDSLLNFHNKYCYQILAYDNSSTNTSESNQSCNQTTFVDTAVIVTVTKTVTSTTNGTVIIRWKSINKPHLAYSVLYYSTDGKTFTILKNNIPPTVDSFAHTGINTQSASQYYYIVTVDSCGTRSDSSLVNKTVTLQVSVGELIHILNWTHYEGFPVKEYYIQKFFGSQFKTIDSTASNDTASKYFPAPCNSVERYRIIAEGYNAVQISWSDTMGRKAIDTIPSDAPIMKNATVLNGTSTQINFVGSDSLDTYDFVIQRSTNGNWNTAGNILFTTPGKALTYIDNAVNTQTQHLCYTIIARDSCLNATPSDTFCVIDLRGNALNLADSLHWNPFKGYKIQKYDILQLVGNKWDTLSKVNSNDTSYTQKPLACDVSQTYKIEGFENGGTYVTMSDSITLTPFDTTKPPAPIIKYATVLNDNQIELFWHKSISKVKLYELSIKTGNGAWKVTDTVKIDSFFTFSGLNTPDSIYDFRVVAIDSCAQNRSQPSVFHSPVQLSGKGQNLSNLLTWKPYQGWTSVSNYFIYQLVSGSWIEIGTVNGTTTSYLQSNLPCDVTQSYKIAALDNTGQYLSYSDTVKITPYDTIKPPAPVIKYATVLSDNQIELFWDKSIPKVKLYELSIKTGNGPWNVLTTISIDTSFTFNGLNTRDSLYDFRVVAIDSCAANRSPNSAFHSPVKISGTPLDDSVLIKWTPYIGFASVKEYYIYQYGSLGWVILDSVKGNITSYKSKAMPCNVPQAYSIGTVDNTGQFVSYSDSMHIEPFDTIKPKAPVLYDATVLPGQAVKLSWGWDPTTDVKYFEIWRSTNGGALSLIDTVIYDSVYIDTKANVKSNRYAYSIIAIDSCSPKNRSPRSNTDSLIHLQASTYYCTPQIGLQWSSYAGLGVSAYTVYRSTDGTNFTSITSLTPTQLSYTDNTVSAGIRYYYVVEATNGKTGYNSYSDTLGIFPNIVPLADSAQLVYATVIKSGETDGAIMVRWRRDSRADSNARGYYVYSYNTTNGKYSLVEDQTNLNDTTYIDNNVNTLQFAYRYYIVIYNICDIGINSKIHRPILLTVNNGDLNAQLTWENYLGVGVKSYTVYKSTDHGPAYFFANTGTDTALADSNIYCNHSYTYLVQAALANNEISFSDSVTITAFDTIRPVTKPILSASVFKTGIKDGMDLLYLDSAIDSNLAGYNIYRSDDGIMWTLDGTVGISNFYGFFSDFDLNTYGQPYYYRIQPFDSCGNLGDYSPIHKTIHLKVTAQNGYNMLNWNAYVGWKVKKYVLIRNSVLIASVGKDTLNFKDSLVYCDTMYHYQVVGIRDTSGQNFGAGSNTDSVKSFDHIGPQKVYIKRVTVSKPNKSVTISWTPSGSFGVKEYHVYRKYAIDGSMKQVGITSDTTFTDSSSEVVQPDCYYVFAGDYCGNLSNGSNEGCIMILSAKNKPGYNDLSWNGYYNWYNGTQTYNVYKNEDNQGLAMIGTTSSGSIDSFIDNNLSDTTIDFCYQVEAVENPGQYNEVSRSTVECVHQDATVFIPNSFTPFNQDGINDFFGPVGAYIRNYTMQIYDRWGEEIYNTTSSKAWDGNFKGQFVQQGIYIYYITIQDYNGHITRFKGTLTMFE